MVYRIYNPELVGLQNEDAYLLMCKEAMPDGLLGLMLGGMIFATASSLNTTLNISAGVFTNDIFRRVRPEATDKLLMRVARCSTLGFGILAVIIALLIQSMGGIVNVVISVGALTGVPVYLPIIWSLFSKRQTARSILGVTFISLAINLFFKFVSPVLFGFSLDREWEMIIGSVIPIVLLLISEWSLKRKGFVDPMFDSYVVKKTLRVKEETTDENAVRQTNCFTRKVLGIGITVAGGVIVLLGVLAEEGWFIPFMVGTVVFTLGILLLFLSRKK